MLDVSSVNARLNVIETGLADVVIGIQNKDAEIAALREQIDPEAQAKVDAIAGRLDNVVVVVEALKAAAPLIPPPGTPA